MANVKNGNQKGKQKVVRKQPRKDSRAKRINLDNERISKYDADNNTKITPPMETCRSNDIKWYSLNNELLQNSGRYNFYNVLGNPLPYPMFNGTNSKFSIPGVMKLAWCPYAGGVQNLAINQSAKSVYSYVVHANSRNTSYSFEDLFMVIVGAADIFAEISNLIRAYGVMTMYDGKNRYLPEALISAMGLNFSDVRENYSHMLYDINNLIAQSRQLWIPKDLPFIERWFWLNAHIYTDSESPKAQMYMFVSSHTLTIEEMQSEQGTRLAYSDKFGGNKLSWAAAVSQIQTMLDAMINSEDRGVIMGDILKAYGSDRIFALNEIATDYITTPVYDKEVLTQIENATVWGTAPTYITQDPENNVMYTDWEVPTTAYTNAELISKGIVGINNVVLNFHQLESPTPEQIMIATRLTAVGASAYSKDGKTTYTPYAAGTELLTYVETYCYTYDSSGSTIRTDKLPCKGEIGIMQAFSFYMMLWTAFDWAPALYLVDPSDISGFLVNPRIVLTEWDNYTILNQLELERLHTTALFSEFNVPTLV